MSTLAFALAVVVLAGFGAAAQPAFNSQLARILGSPFRAALVNFSAGMVILSVMVAALSLRGGLPSTATLSKVPIHLWVVGGALGAIFVTTAAWATPKIGAGGFFATLIAAQMIAAIVLDHFGLIGLDVKQISLPKVLGATMLVGGALLVVRG